MSARMKTMLCLCVALAAGPAVAQEQGMDYAALDDVLLDLGGVPYDTTPDWTDEDRQTFLTARQQLDQLLQGDPDNPVAATWFLGRLTNARGEEIAWKTYGPVTWVEMTATDPLAIDRALYFTHATMKRLGQYPGKIDEETCLAQKALRLQVSEPQSLDDVAFLSAVYALSEAERLGLRAASIGRKMNSAGSDFAAIIADPERLSNLVRAQILDATLNSARDFDPEAIRQEFWVDPEAGERLADDLIGQAIDSIAATDLPRQITKSRPFLLNLDSLKASPPRMALSQLCQ